MQMVENLAPLTNEIKIQNKTAVPHPFSFAQGTPACLPTAGPHGCLRSSLRPFSWPPRNEGVPIAPQAQPDSDRQEEWVSAPAPLPLRQAGSEMCAPDGLPEFLAGLSPSWP